MKEWKKGRRSAEDRKGGREETGKRESLQCPEGDKLGKEEQKEKWKICKSTIGDSNPSDKNEGVLSDNDNRDVWVKNEEWEKEKSAHMDSQVKLHYQ